MISRRAVFLDRDGTLTRDIGFTHRVADLEFLENVLPGLRLLTEQGFRLYIVTNQSGVARGVFTEEDMHAFHAALLERLAAQGVNVDRIYACPLHETEGLGIYRRASQNRKPAPGMLLDAARQYRVDLTASYMIGDKRSDVEAGRAAGCRTILVRTGTAGRGEAELPCRPDWTADDLLDAARIIEQREREPLLHRQAG